MNKEIKGSYILVARNDYYCGDSVGRLTNTLNFLGKALNEKKKLNQSECILVDWASPDKPLKEVLNLNDEIKKILKIITVPSNIALKYQKDSPFSEVHAMNVAARHMSGKYFLRIDQDTLVGYRFINWFYEEHEVKDYGFKWPEIAFCGRRNLSPEESLDFEKIIKDDKLSKKVFLLHDLNYKNTFSIEPNYKIGSFPSFRPIYGSAVGVLMVSHKLLFKNKGFNEELIYMNHMDVEFYNRLCCGLLYDNGYYARKKDINLIYNLSQKIENDFYHQHHERFDAATGVLDPYSANESGKRITNSLLYRKVIFKNPNDEDWGLRREKLNGEIDVCIL